jgi:phage gp45-like
MIRDFSDVCRRVLALAGIPRSTAPAVETSNIQTVQVTHQVTGEVQDGVPSMQLFGFASSSNPGTDHFVIYLEGDRSKGVAIASNDQRVRPKGLLGGESKVYDASGQFIYLQAGTKIIVNGVTEIDFQISGALVGKFTASGLAVTGTITSTGNITAGFGGSDQVDMQHHDHIYNPGGGSPTQTSQPVAGS